MDTILLLSYLGGVILMALFALLVIFNFVRYSFKGDLTYFFIAIFAAAFVIISMGSLLLLQNPTVTPTINTPQQFN
ncbi:hypothetical protein BH11PAT4_BH11PAT4_0330 [soil metagenome]